MKIGVLGAGHLGQIHLKVIKEIEGFDLVGFYDPDEERSKDAARDFKLPAFESVEALIDVFRWGGD